MYDCCKILVTTASESPIKLRIIDPDQWGTIQAILPAAAQSWIKNQGLTQGLNSPLIYPSDELGNIEVLVPLKKNDDGFSLAKLCWLFPDRLCQFIPDERGLPPFTALAWGLEAYQFERYRTSSKKPSRLLCSDQPDYHELISAIQAVTSVRDLINLPANDFGPDELQQAAETLAAKFNAQMEVTLGEKLKQEFPLIHWVGQASPRAPRLLDLIWGSIDHPKVTLVGKGVCFDTGGLDLKPKSGMGLMKKDMGGAAHVLGLAQMIMTAGLPIRLRVLIPAVENSVAGSAMRPGDIFTSRKGLTVEIDNTDAEGRLILADALSLADDEKPDLLIDMATLTGAARVALGPELPPYFTDDEELASGIAQQAVAQKDPVWRLPLWTAYNNLFSSSLADLSNSSDSSFAGSILAALFLKRFVVKTPCYVHFDIYGWQPQAKPGSPKGGEAQAIRLLYNLIKQRYRN